MLVDFLDGVRPVGMSFPCTVYFALALRKPADAKIVDWSGLDTSDLEWAGVDFDENIQRRKTKIT